MEKTHRLRNKKERNAGKRRFCFLLLALCLSLMVSCSKDTAQPVTINGVEVIFGEDGASFSYGEDTYHYKYTASGNEVSVTYPNGITITRSYSSHGYAEGWPMDAEFSDLDGYLDRDTVFDLLGGGKSSNDRSGNGGYGLIGLLCTAIGAFNCFATERSWYLSHGWHYRNAEPSELSLGWIKGSGGILMVVGVILLLAGLF